MNINPILLQKRHRRDKTFRLLARTLTCFSLFILLSMILTLTFKGTGAFYKTTLLLDVPSKQEAVSLKETSPFKDLRPLLLKMLSQTLKMKKASLEEQREIVSLLSVTAPLQLYRVMEKEPKGNYIPLRLSDEIDQMIKQYKLYSDKPYGTVTINQKNWLRHLQESGRLQWAFNWDFFTKSDSRDPMASGIWGAFIGSCYLLLTAFFFALPLGVFTAIYLEEFSKKNWFTDFIEVNISNLAAVPSIIFGLLGLSVLIGFFGMPRSSALTGGATLSFMMMPTIVMSTRTALKAVPKAIREAAYGLGASKIQTVFHHVLPLAIPGIATGTVLSLSRAIGESAPLLMIGMAAFMTQAPQNIFDASTSLPLQIFTWARNPDRGFIENAAGAIIILLCISGLISYTALWIRKKFERTW